MKKKIVIVSGDPKSINTEIIYKAWNKLNLRLKKNVFLIGNYKLICNQIKKIKKKDIFIKVKNINTPSRLNKIKIIDVPLNFKKPFSVSNKNAQKYVINSLNIAHNLGTHRDVKGIINCPIDKKLIVSTNKVGVTEFFAGKCKIKNNSEVMLIHNKKLSVVPITTHIDLEKVSKTINKKLIENKMKTLNKFYIKIFKKRPKISILGLNPHNAELRKNSKEKNEILPAINYLKKRGLNIVGPFSADTIFINNLKSDVIVGMYHDQVLTPFKTLFKFDAINITLGLKYMRVSPDHGTATNLIGKNKANCESLLKCINFLDKLDK